ncbi:ATP-binding protein [Flavobacterium sp. CBA20B-1]|uniref:ATP-binding protein n=1 Tax=unclassified Flavobacterium TaxID=196869 RepID=UPI002224A3E8|nr:MULTISPECIES: ATP-binding protein [unclassified Flavobacterium]WCM42237.1 ATP-binding protein [Flavobacterium sp. CBA20B-1]
MKFYNRDKELNKLRNISDRSAEAAQMTFVVGRRRIGKTSLLIKATEKSECLYFFIAKKSEVLLCAEFVDEIKQVLNIPVFGEIKTFKEIFGFLMELSKTRRFTLIIDEFQEFTSVNPSVYSEMQHIWDANKSYSKINLILCGSVYSMMMRIFENAKEPLFGRATQRIYLKAFNLATLKEILNDYSPNYSNEDLLAFFLFTGGVAKYVELLVQAKAFSLEAILEEILTENSLFLEEGKNVLIDEFGKDYGNYFSILSLIASGKTSRTEIESIMEMQTGGFLDRLENEYRLIKKTRPILAKPNSRSVKYSIEDNFLQFWFRFIYKYRSAVEIGNLEYVKNIIQRDYAVYSGKILERYFIEKLSDTKSYNNIGSYWERNNQNEIDIVAVNDLDKKVLFGEVKRNQNKIDIKKLKEKTQNLQSQFKNYQIDYQGFSLTNM